MKLAHLKKIRILVSGLIFIALLFVFLSIQLPVLGSLGELSLRLQLLPSVLRFMALFFSLSAMGFILVILLTVIFGRIYCSSICPMGTFQDIVIAISRTLKKKKQQRFHYTRNRKLILRYTTLGVTLVLWISGSLFLLNVLDPYSNFGKLSVSVIQPAYIWLNNTVAFTLERFDIFAVAPMSMHSLPWNMMMVSLGVVSAIIVMAAWRGRLFCNTLCPAGAILGLFSFRPIFRIAFTPEACTACKKCEWVCKAECLDSQSHHVDHNRCISCFNCFASCPNQGLYFTTASLDVKHTVKQKTSGGKREFLLTLASGLLSIPLLRKKSLAQGQRRGQGGGQQLQLQDRSQAGMIPPGVKKPVTPPGSISHEHFTKNCIACYLCVSKCPTKVISPSFFDFGLEGFMQPKLDFEKSFCNYDCVACTEICPTGAITKQTPEDKRLIKIGVARFLVEGCVVTADRTDCGACSEHCPSKAVQMVPYEDGLFIPQVTPSLCIGCGACEFACPTEPYKAIYVTGMPVHRTARPPETSDSPQEDAADDFPF